MKAWDRVTIARAITRPKSQDFIQLMFEDFYELKGDRGFHDDPSIIGGVATLNKIPVTIIAQTKGKTVEENLEKKFGMTSPQGYRKALRLAKQAEKFNRPIINFVDTPGAYPGKQAEEGGQAQAIAECLFEFSNIQVPVICVVLSEGGSGGALALSIGDRIVMLENAIYSILSPEGFATILWKDQSRAKEASEVMKLTSYDLFEKEIVEKIISEPTNDISTCIPFMAQQIKEYIVNQLEVLTKIPTKQLLKQRYHKYRKIGSL